MDRKDSIIVLSRDITPNLQLTGESNQRVDKGIELFRQGVADVVIMNGGSGYIQGGYYLSYGVEMFHGLLMAEYALKQGVPLEQILIQPYSRDTIGEAYYVKEMFLKPKRWENNVIVTSNFHVPRCRIIYDKVLGPDFKTEFAGVATPLDNNSWWLEREERNLDWFLRNFGDDIKRGDSAAIEARLFDVNELYKSIPHEFRRRFY
ncbi:YdcF family protein [Candidatus Woesearchaeota archaeon]|nr:YdcF family protein [Candidatus Woesearchaeota archaeon]